MSKDAVIYDDEPEGWLCSGVKQLVIVASLLLIGCSPPGGAIEPAAVRARPAAAGVGVCHYVPADGLAGEVDFGTETTTVTHWKHLEAVRGQYDLGRVDEYIKVRQGMDVGVWFGIQTYGADLAGLRKAPQWLVDEGAVWHNAGCSDHKGMFAPWDAVYLGRLSLLLAAVNAHISAQAEGYRDTIAGIVMMSGGVYGETHLYEWSETCNLEVAMRDYYRLGLTDAEFDEAYAESVLRILDVYMAAFPDWPIMVQLGRPSVDEWLLQYGSAAYPGRLYAKWQGWSPTNVGDGRDGIRRRANEIYADMFERYRYIVVCGYEPGHPSEEWHGAEQYLNAMEWARDASFVCFQAGATLRAAQALPQFAAFDARLEANAGIRVTPTPARSAVCTPTFAPTATSTATRRMTRTATPGPSVDPPIVLHCECRRVTVTPTTEQSYD